MKQLLILSGKGGTGKTTIASAFISISNAKVYADCDVDAPNLHLAINQTVDAQKKDYYGLDKAYINNNLCIKCNSCISNCRFDAILSHDKYNKVNEFACEGCGVCEKLCPVKAIKFKKSIDGEIDLYKNKGHIFSTAKLKMGSGTSGLLVTEVKKQIELKNNNAEFALIDGSPGIGCPVIASISGVDMVLVVAEPTISGINDMKRIIKTARGFDVKIAVCINKFNINQENARKIEAFCQDININFVGKIPFDLKAVSAINNGYTIADVKCISGEAVRKIYNNTKEILFS